MTLGHASDCDCGICLGLITQRRVDELRARDNATMVLRHRLEAIEMRSRGCGAVEPYETTLSRINDQVTEALAILKTHHLIRNHKRDS